MRIPILETKDCALVPVSRPMPAFAAIKALVLDAVPSPYTKRAYGQALDEFLSWYTESSAAALNKAVVNRYRTYIEARGLSPSSVNKHLAAIRKLVTEGADNGLLDGATAESIRRVKGAKREGRRLGNWLSMEQAQLLLYSPDHDTLKGKRDIAIFAVLIGAGLRRSEAAALTVEHIQEREGRWVLVDLVGKHGRVRSVPIASWVKAAIDHWITAASITSGRLFRAINKGGAVVGEEMTEQALYNIVAFYALKLNIKFAPHDCRRTFAKLSRKAGSNIEQIQKSLGHASIQTTERYLGTQQDLQDAPSDRIRLRLLA